MTERTFISYARADSELALSVAEDLRGAGVGIWIDQLDIPVGHAWDEAVEAALRSCSVLLVVLSPSAVASKSVLDEVSYALDEGKRTVPLIAEDCEVPFRLRRLQHADFRLGYEEGMGRLRAALAPTAAEGPARTKTVKSTPPLPAAETSSTESGVQDDAPTPLPTTPGPWTHRLFTGLAMALAGALASAVLHVLIYSNDVRPNDPRELALTGGAISGTIWFLAGIVAGPRLLPLLFAFAASATVLAGWVAIFGTYEDVLSAAVMYGWPVSGILGAWIGGEVLTFRRDREGYWASRRPHLLTALATGGAGAIATALLNVLIYAANPDLESVLEGLIAGAIWGCAGAVAGPSRPALAASLTFSLVVLAAWIGVYGTRNDVVYAALIFGAPFGGVLGAWIAVELGRRSSDSSSGE